MVYHGPWHTMAYYGIPWYTKDGIPWYPYVAQVCRMSHGFRTIVASPWQKAPVGVSTGRPTPTESSCQFVAGFVCNLAPGGDSLIGDFPSGDSPMGPLFMYNSSQF